MIYFWVVINMFNINFKSIRNILFTVIEVDLTRRKIGLYGISINDIHDYGLFKQLKIMLVVIDNTKPLDEIECSKQGITLVLYHSNDRYAKFDPLHLVYKLLCNEQSLTSEIILMIAFSHMPNFKQYMIRIMFDGHDQYIYEQIQYITLNNTNISAHRRYTNMLSYIHSLKSDIKDNI